MGLITDLTITAGEEGILIHTTMLRGVFEFGIHIGCRCYADTTGFHESSRHTAEHEGKGYDICYPPWLSTSLLCTVPPPSYDYEYYLLSTVVYHEQSFIRTRYNMCRHDTTFV